MKEVPIMKPIGIDTVLLNIKSKLYLFPKFCDPRQRKKISNVDAAIFKVNNCIFTNINKINIFN